MTILGLNLTMRRYDRKALLRVQSTTQAWLVEQDCLLIENPQLSLAELSVLLKFSEEEIYQRQQLLGLIQRKKSEHRLDQSSDPE